MRKICVNLDELGDEAITEIMRINKCTISDAVNIALVAFAKDNADPVMTNEDTPVTRLSLLCEIKLNMSLGDWCESRGIDKARLRYLVNRCESGGTVWGFGNTDKKNQWRDKQHGQKFKTHTAYIASCLNDDFGIDLI